MSRDDLPANYANYKVSKEKSFLGVKIIERVGPDENDIKVAELILDESAVIRMSFSLYIFITLLFPEYLINSIWIPLLMPFSGTDKNGKECGWIQLRGTNETSGFGKRKAYNLYTNVIKKRKSFALKWVLSFFVLAMITYSVTESLGYTGLNALFN